MAATFDVLIVGCGAIAGGYDADRDVNAPPLTHASAFQRHGGFRLKGCVDPDETKRLAFAKRWAVEASFADIETATAGTSYDVISICSPTSLHNAHLDAALGARPRLVFAEKPVTGAFAETQRVVAAFEAATVLLAVNHTRRWAPDVVRLREELRTGRWGEVRSAIGVYNKGALNNGAHMIDLLNFLLGPVELLSAGRPVWDHWTDDPSVPALLSAGSVPVMLGLAHAADYALFELSLICEDAVISMEDGGARWRIRSAVDSPTFPGYRAVSAGEWRDGAYGHAMSNAVSEIYRAIDEGAALSSTGRTAAQAQLICDAMTKAALARPDE